jgi:acyl-CoA thioester hydrolase
MKMPTNECHLEFRVRYAECDPMGYLHHAKYFEFFEMGRMELLRHTGISYRDMEERGFFIVVAKLECKYLKPARFDDELKLRVSIERMTRARIDHRYELFRDDQLICQANTTVACVDRAGHLIPMPEELFKD